MKKELTSIIRPGVKLKYDGAQGTRTWHIRAVVDKQLVIYRTWQNSRWVYEPVSVANMQALYDAGLLTNGRKHKKKEKG